MIILLWIFFQNIFSTEYLWRAASRMNWKLAWSWETDLKTMSIPYDYAASKEKHAGATDKRPITVTLSESLDGHILPFQLIYTG